MPDEPTESLPKLLKDRQSLLRLKEAMEKRLANIHSKEEEREVDALVKRAFDPQCTFDRKHTKLL
jgi:hypothetical protein